MTAEEIELITGNIKKHLDAANEAFDAAALDKGKDAFWNARAISNLAQAAEYICMVGYPIDIMFKAFVPTAMILSRNNHPKAPQFIERLLHTAPNHPGGNYRYAYAQLKAGNLLLAYQGIILAETFKRQYDFMEQTNPGQVVSPHCTITEIEDLKLAIEYVLADYADLSQSEVLAKANDYYRNVSPLRSENREMYIKIEPTPEPTEPEAEETDEDSPDAVGEIPSASILNIDAEYYEEEEEVDEEPAEPEADLPETYPV